MVLLRLHRNDVNVLAFFLQECRGVGYLSKMISIPIATSVLSVPLHLGLQLPRFYFAFFITNSRSLSDLFSDKSWCPLRLTHLEMSSSDSGSSASTLRMSPILSRSISIFVRN